MDQRRPKVSSLSEEDKQHHTFQLVWCLCCVDGHVEPPAHIVYRIDEVKAYRSYWECVHVVGHKGIDQAKNLILSGHERPLPRVKERFTRPADQTANANAWFLRWYTSLGEHEPVSRIGEPLGAENPHMVSLEFEGHPAEALPCLVYLWA